MRDVLDQKEQRVVECWFQRDVAKAWPAAVAHKLPLVVRTDAITLEVADLPHRHQDFCALYLVRQGRGVHVIDGTPYGISRGDVYVMALGVTHLYSSFDDLVLDALYFTPDVFDRTVWDLLAATPGFLALFVEEPLHRTQRSGESGRWLHLSPEAYANSRADLAELHSEWSADTPIAPLMVRGLFLRLLVHLSRLYAGHGVEERKTARTSRLPHETTVAAAVRYLDERYAEPIRIEDLASQVFLSPDRFTEVFAALMGRTPSDYLRHVRLECARSLLVTTEASISEIGGRVGFPDPAYFTRVFRAANGMTPSQYRKSWHG